MPVQHPSRLLEEVAEFPQIDMLKLFCRR